MKRFRYLILLTITILLAGCSNVTSLNLEPYKEENKKEEYNASVFTVGDVLLHMPVIRDGYTSSGYNFTPMFSYVKDIVADYDLAFYNQESPMGGSSLGYSGYPRFNCPDAIGQNMIDLGFNLVSLTNNHTLDTGVTGASYYANYWAKKDSVLAVGSHTSWDERNKVVIKEKNGITYTLLAYTTVTNGTSVPSEKNYLRNVYSEAQVRKDVAKVRDKVDVVMVSMHWGTENVNEPTWEQQQQAKFLASLGVDVVIGHHSHTVQPITFIGDTLVIYSLGNFISNQKDVSVNNNVGLMVGFNIKKEVENGESSISITDVKGDLFWVDSKSHTNYRVVPFNKVTTSMLYNKDSVYAKYSAVINKYKNDAIKVGHFE